MYNSKLDLMASFDAEFYLSEYPDVALLKMDPLEHYLWLGRRLGRRPGRVVDMDARQRVSLGVGATEPIIWKNSLSRGPSIAAVAHVYYSDLIDDVCVSLAQIPYKFSAYFAVRDTEMIAQIQSALKKLKVNCSAHFAVCPNRGRNFGGFLVEFRKAVRAHDLCVHIHTKKSLRTGSEQDGWREHLFDGLLGDKSTVATILSRFVDEPQLGLVVPTTYNQMPAWCHHWLQSGGRVDEISRMLGISGMPRRGLIDYPVGSMFWARTAAIAPLLDFPWEYEHFEAEPIGDDGSMAHVIERVIGLLVPVMGYDYLEISKEENIFRRNFSEKLLHYHKDSWNVACGKVQNSDVVSFDFYDTLFCRNSFTPDDVHNYIGWVLEVRGNISSEREFYKVRKAAEEYARIHSGRGDVSLDEIYSFFPNVCTWSDASISLARQLEWDIELRCLVPRPDMIELVRMAKQHGARVLIVSDSYMPRHFFEHVLDKHEMRDLFDEIYVSSELGLRKDRGDIWSWIKANEADGRRFHHVGDNEVSDIQNCVDNHLGEIYVVNTTMLAQLCGLGPRQDFRVGSPVWRDGILHGPVVARLCSNAFLQREGFRPIRLTHGYDVGYSVWGPLFFGFLTWVIQQARQDVGRVFFLAREGWFLTQIYEKIRVAVAESGVILPKGQYLIVSRKSLMGPMAVVDFDPDFIVRGAAFRGTLGEMLMARLGVELGSDVAETSQLVDTERDREHAIALLLQLREHIVGAMEGRLNVLKAYLSQEGADQPGGLLVDVGYSGTIQTALQAITGIGYKGAYMATTQESSSVLKHGGEALSYFSHNDNSSIVHKYSLILEAVLTAPHGSAAGYVENGKRIDPILGEESESQLNFSYLEEQIEGAVAYVSELLETYGSEIALTTFSPRESEAGFRQLIAGIVEPHKQFWEKISVEDDFCGERKINIRQAYDI